MLWWWATRPSVQGSVADRVAPELWEYSAGNWRTAELSVEEGWVVAVDDPIFLYEANRPPRQIGHITLVEPVFRSGQRTKARATFYPDAPANLAAAEVTYHATPNSMEWVVETMLPPEKRTRIMDELRLAMQQHQDELIAAVRPVMEKGLRDALVVVQDDLPKVIQSHRAELQALSARYQRDIVQEDLLPVVKEEVWPIARKHAEPVATQVGMELWQRVSIWRFGWRYVYDKSPLPEKNLFHKEWERYVQDEAEPILEAHTEDFVRLVQQITAESLRNPEVQKALRESFLQMVEDPELQKIVWKIIREIVIDNPRLKQVLDKHWSELRQTVSVVAAKLEPSVRKIGDLLFGTREGGITPEFARVLRNQVLLKDKRWLAVRVPGEHPLLYSGGARGSSEGSTPSSSDPLSFTVRPGPKEITNDNPFPVGMAGLEDQ